MLSDDRKERDELMQELHYVMTRNKAIQLIRYDSPANISKEFMKVVLEGFSKDYKESNSELPIHEFLGISLEEYTTWEYFLL
jgi:hypothetical protein